MRPANSGQHALAMIANIYFASFVAVVLIFTIIATTYKLEDPFFHPSAKITNQIAFTTFINITDEAAEISPTDCEEEIAKPIECSQPEIFHTMMRAAIEKFNDIHFYRFGKPIRGSDDNTCDMAWRFRSKDDKSAAFHKDYRRFLISRWQNCTISVISIGEYHTGVNARKRKKTQKEGVNDTLPLVESREAFKHGKYLIYSGGGDRCKNMKHYLWSFLCALGEAQYLNRTLVMDLSLCLSSMYTKNSINEEGKDFRYYFDFEHLKKSASVIDQGQFSSEWTEWNRKDSLSLKLVENLRVTPMKLRNVKDSLIVRKFGNVEPENYWYRVCETEAESVVQRPWHLLRKSRRLMDIVSAIMMKLNQDYDSVRVIRGKKAKSKDISADLRDKVVEGRNLYISSNETDVSIFDRLKDKYTIHFVDDYKELWDENSEWYLETAKINGYPVEFDGYMRISVDTEVLLRGKKQIEIFNEFTSDSKME